MSAVRSEDTVERFRTSVDMKRNHSANLDIVPNTTWRLMLCVHFFIYKNTRFIVLTLIACAIEVPGRTVVMDTKSKVCD